MGPGKKVTPALTRIHRNNEHEVYVIMEIFLALESIKRHDLEQERRVLLHMVPRSHRHNYVYQQAAFGLLLQRVEAGNRLSNAVPVRTNATWRVYLYERGSI